MKEDKIIINSPGIAIVPMKCYKEKTADEIWLTIKQNENYEVSNFGKVRNKKTKKELKTWKNSRGYLIITIRNGLKPYCYTLHRLVAEHFIENKLSLSEVNHKDGNRSNNNVENLEWCTRSYNIKDMWKRRRGG